jgi:adenylate cyclase
VATRGGRVIKTIGDEVLFTAGSVQEGAEIAFALLEIGDQDDLPPLRVGLAYGEVVLRHGDVFGEVVNIASRLVSLARPSSVLVDREAAALLDGQDGWELRRLRPQRVRGYEHLVATVLRRAG